MSKNYKDFEKFYEHPFIKSISDNEKWSISDINKRPIDMFTLKYQNKVVGAKFTDSTCLMNLNDLCELVPNATNNAYHMDYMLDNFVVLDIEKTCPEDIKNEFLKLPYIYGEYSLSGKGYHLIFEAPNDILDKYPIAKNKMKMQEVHGYYEILLNQWVTFTRNMLPDATGTNDFNIIFEDLASKQTESTSSEKIDIEKSFDVTSIPNFDKIMNILSQQKYKKDINDFENDLSKFEFGCAGFYHYKLSCILEVTSIKESHDYTPNDKVWLLYTIISDVIPYREKHNENRNQMPWLFYIANEIVAKNLK